MARSLLLLVIGIIGGSALVLTVWRADSADLPYSDASATPVEAVDLPAPVPAAAGREGGYAARRLAIFEEALESDSVIDLERGIRQSAGEPRSRLRDLKLEALLARLAEIDPAYAVQIARNNYLDTPFFITVFEIWARTDPEEALAELAIVSPPGRQREIALAIVSALGGKDADVGRVAAALPASARPGFEVDALTMQAEADPIAAIARIARLENDYQKSMALQQVVELAAASDPLTALASLAVIEPYSLRVSIQGFLVGAWAELDPDAVFAWIESAAIAELPNSPVAYQRLAEADASRLFSLLDRLPPSLRTSAQRVAMQALASSDAVAALAMLETMPPSQDRDRLLQTIAQTYGSQSPDLALAWVETLPAAQRQAAYSNVLQGIASTNPERAVDLVLAEIDGRRDRPSPGLQTQVLSVISRLASSGSVDMRRIADRIVASNVPNAQLMASMMMSSWTRSDAEGALSWAIDNADVLEASAFTQIARSLGESNPDRAVSVLEQLPPAQQEQWAEGLAQILARNDVDRALGLIDRYGRQPGFEGLYGTVAREMSRTDPAAAAALLDKAPMASASGQAPGSVSSNLPSYVIVAREWAGRDPAAAADWALGIGDERTRAQAVSQTTAAWAGRDLQAATQWSMSLPVDARRDAALDGLMSAAAQVGRFEPQFLSAYSTPVAGQQAASRAIIEIGRNDPSAAQRLLETHITDPAIRQQTASTLTQTAGSGGSPNLSLGGLIF